MELKRTFEEYNSKDPKQLAQEIFDELLDVNGEEIADMDKAECMHMLKMRGIKGGLANKVCKEILRLTGSLSESSLNEGLHAKIKKAMKAVEKGETVTAINIRFPGRFKILKIAGGFATVDYQDGTEPFDMAAQNIDVKSIVFESAVTEKYDGTATDFKYEIQMAIENELGISPVAIKAVKKKGKGFEVRMSSYMSNPDAWRKLGDAIGAELKDFKKGSINIGIYESVSLNEANKDGTISDDEDERRDQLEYEVYHRAEELVNYIKEEAEEIGGPFRGPGIISDCLKQVSDAFKKNKMRLR